MGMKFTWNCDLCGRRVADGDGYLEVDDQAARGRAQIVEEQLRALSARYVDGAIPVSEIATTPRVAWVVYHRDCDPDSESGYWLGVERCRTLEHLLNWNAHLHEKDWLEHTDWDRFIQRRLAPNAIMRKAS
jgi:hypothetical protein